MITGLSTGGAERSLYNLLSGGLASRFHSAVISLRDRGALSEQIENLNVPVHALGVRHGVVRPAALWHAHRFLQVFQPNVVQGWMYHGNLAASAAAAVAPGQPAVAWNVRHSLYRLRDEKWTTRWVIRAGRQQSSRPDAIIYNSSRSRYQHEAFGFAAERGRVIPNGFDVVALTANTEVRARVRQALKIPNDASVVGHVGRFHPMKDHASFLRAAVAVAYVRPKSRFLLVGRNVSLDNPTLVGIVPSELESRFHFLGERDDVPDLMKAMDWFCLSSWSEAFPNVVGEAMASALPCVVTDVGDTADVVGNAGFIVPPKNPEKLVAALLEATSLPEQKRARLGEIALRRIKNQYVIDASVLKYDETYRDLVLF